MFTFVSILVILRMKAPFTHEVKRSDTNILQENSHH